MCRAHCEYVERLVKAMGPPHKEAIQCYERLLATDPPPFNCASFASSVDVLQKTAVRDDLLEAWTFLAGTLCCYTTVHCTMHTALSDLYSLLPECKHYRVRRVAVSRATSAVSLCCKTLRPMTERKSCSPESAAVVVTQLQAISEAFAVVQDAVRDQHLSNHPISCAVIDMDWLAMPSTTGISRVLRLCSAAAAVAERVIRTAVQLRFHTAPHARPGNSLDACVIL